MRLFLYFAAALFLLAEGGRAQALVRNGDVFEMRLSGMPVEFANEFASQYTVDDGGEVRVSMIGGMRAAGLSTTQLARNIERKLVSDRIFTNPTVTINLKPESRFVTVGGAVRVPQAVPWTTEMTLSSAIIRAGGFNDFPDQRKIKVTRQGKPSVYNLKRADRDPTQNPMLLPGDEVMVPE